MFAANLDSTDPCHEGARQGCDIYLVNYNDGTGQVSDLLKVAGQPGVGEWGPQISPDACWVTFNFDDPVTGTHGVIANVNTGHTNSLPNGMTSVTWSADGKSVAWVAGAPGAAEIYTSAVTASCDDDNIAFAKPVQVSKLAGTGRTPVAPRFTADGKSLLVELDSTSPATAQIALLPLDGSTPAQPIASGPVAQPAMRSDGAAAVMTNTQQPVLSVVQADQTGAWGSLRTFLSTSNVEEYAKLEPRYGACDGVAPRLPSWMGDLAVLYTLPCQQAGGITFSHLMTSTVDASDAAHTIDLSVLIQDLASKGSKDFDDGTAIRLPNGGRIGEPIT